MEIFYLCLKIFFARISDVSLGTIRTIMTVKEKTLLASLIAFLEILIWFNIARVALNTTLTSFWIPVAYAGGYAMGTFLGSIFSRHFIKGIIGVQVVTDKLSEEMLKAIRSEGFAVSVIKLEKQKEEHKDMLYIQINNFKLKKLINIIKKHDNSAFIVVSETKYTQNGFIK